MSAGGFDLITPGRDGLVGLTMDPTLPKRKRGLWLLQAGEVRAEKDKGLQNPQVYLPSDPANAYLWPSDPRKMAPRGTASSWSTAFPGLKRKTGQWLPLESAHAPNEDYRERPADLVSAVWYGGELPGNTSAVLLPNTSHEKPGLLAYPGGGPIVSHHLGNQPPKYSRWFWDIKGDEIDPDRGAGAHTFTRVRRMPRAFCTAAPANPRQTVATPDPAALPPSTKFNAVMLNGTKSVGDHTGWLSTHFNTADAALAAEVYGMLRAGPPNRTLGKTEDGDYRAAALDWDRHLYSDGTDANTGPLELLRTQWEEGSKGNVIKRVEARIDRKQLVDFLCGPRPGMIKWQTWDTWEPPSPITPRPKDKPPRDPVTGPDPTTFLKVPAPDPWPDNGANGDPHTTSSYEAAAPSIYGIAMPGLPDGSNRTRSLDQARSENERQWLAEIGMTPAEFHGGKHASVHLVFTAQHSSATATAGEIPTDRWPVAASQNPETRVDRETGRVIQSRMGFAPGALVLAAGNVPRGNVYNVTGLPNTPDAHSLIVLAGATSGPTEVHKGRIGLGRVLPNSARVASGLDVKLTYTGDGGINTPDVQLDAVDQLGAATLGEAQLNIATHRLTTGMGRVRVTEDISADTTLSTTHHVVRVTGAYTITLPATIKAGTEYEVVNSHGSAITIARNGNSINGAASDFSLDAGARALITGDADEGGWRVHVAGTTISGGVTDHGALTGLSDDDHTQYHNDTRGDARYTQKSNNLSDLASDDTALVNLITGASNRTPSVSTELPGYNFNGAATSGGALTIQQVFNLITGLTAETAPATNDELALYDNTEGAANSITLANLFKVINSLTAETAPAYNDKLALYDASASNADAVTIANLFGEGKAVVESYSGSGSSGKTITLTGINRASWILITRQDATTSVPIECMANGSTGSVRIHNVGNGGTNTTWFSLDAPAAGSSQSLTLNTTDATVNASGITYNVLVIGTPI